MKDIISKIGFRVVCLISLSSAILMGMYLIEHKDSGRYKLSKEGLIEAERFSRNTAYMIRSSVREYVNEHEAKNLPHGDVVGRLSNPYLREKLGLSPSQLTSTSFSMLDYYIFSVNNNGDSSIVVDATRFGDPEHTPEVFFHLDIYGNWFKIDGVYSLFNMLK